MIKALSSGTYTLLVKILTELYHVYHSILPLKTIIYFKKLIRKSSISYNKYLSVELSHCDRGISARTSPLIALIT
jgi:hypothetical protein